MHRNITLDMQRQQAMMGSFDLGVSQTPSTEPHAAWTISDAQAPARAADGSLKDALEIEFLNSPSDESPSASLFNSEACTPLADAPVRTHSPLGPCKTMSKKVLVKAPPTRKRKCASVLTKSFNTRSVVDRLLPCTSSECLYIQGFTSD